MFDGALTTSPCREQRGAVAVVDYVIPCRMRHADLPRRCRRALLNAVPVPGQGTTASLSLRAGGGGTFDSSPWRVPLRVCQLVAGSEYGNRTGANFGLAAGDEFGDHARREGTQRLPVIGVSHGLNHGGISVREVVSVVQGSSYVQ